MSLCLPLAFTLVSCSAYSSNLKMEVICSSETWVDCERTTRRYIPEDSTLHNHRCENLKSYNPPAVSVEQVFPNTILLVGIITIIRTGRPRNRSLITSRKERFFFFPQRPDSRFEPETFRMRGTNRLRFLREKEPSLA
jgi:hypothetical protein